MAEKKRHSTRENGNKKIVRFRLKLSWKNIFLYGFLLVFTLFVFASFSANDTSRTVPISDIIQQVKDGSVEKLTVSDTRIIAQDKEGKELEAIREPGSNVYTLFNDAGAPLTNLNVVIRDTAGMSSWLNALVAILPIVLMIVFFYFIFRQARGAQESMFSFGKSSARLFAKDKPKVTFADVAGVDEAKDELREIVDFLKNPQKYTSMGARTPKGVLMVGPAGTGKTLLARATAGEAGVAFFSMAGSEFMEMLVGVGASRVRDLFNTAKKQQPAIIFIDEIDAIGRQRGMGLTGGHDEREQTLNQILVEMDGFTPNEQLVVIAATNRPDVLDPALVRPGRFDRKVTLDMPDIAGRKAILAIHAKGKPFLTDGTQSVNWEKVAKRTVGFSGADLENMLNEAAITAARLNKKAIDMKDIEDAATKVKLGPEKKRLQSDEDRRMTAFHEAGHALVGWYMPHMDPVHRISIVSRGMSLGHTMTAPTERSHETRTHLMEQIAMMLGGRAAEELIFSEMTTGASSDIERATEVARMMVIEYGMSKLGPVNLDLDKRNPYDVRALSPDMQSRVDAAVKDIMDEAYAIALSTLTQLRDKMDTLATALLAQETVESEEFAQMMGERPQIASPFTEKKKK